MSNVTIRHGKATIRVEGFAEILKKLNAAGGNAAEAAKDTFDAATPRILAKSQSLVPTETGALKASGRRSNARQSKKGVITASVSYGGPPLDRRSGRSNDLRAIVVHEDTSMKHPGGGEAKFLERPFLEEKEAVMNELHNKVRAALDKL